MDDQVLASIRESEGLPFFPAIAESFKTKGRIIPLLGCIPSRR